MAGDHPWNVPNAITVSRILLSFWLFELVNRGAFTWYTAGLFLFIVLTDVADGYIARKYHLITTFGRIVDPLADKWIICGIFLFLIKIPESGVTPWVAASVFGREMLVTSLRSYLEQQGKDFSASAVGKLKMFLQSSAALACLISLQQDPMTSEWRGWLVPVRDGLVWLMVIVTLYSGYVYVARACSQWQKATNR